MPNSSGGANFTKRMANKKEFLVVILLSAVALGAIALTNRDRIAVWQARRSKRRHRAARPPKKLTNSSGKPSIRANMKRFRKRWKL